MQGDTNEYVTCTRKTIQRNNALAPSDEPCNLPEWRKRDARRAVATKTARRESVRDHRAVLTVAAKTSSSEQESLVLSREARGRPGLAPDFFFLQKILSWVCMSSFGGCVCEM